MPQTPNIGELGEYLVAEWLQAQSWVILHHRWRCRWGEIDLIAQRYSAQQETRDKGQEEMGRWAVGERGEASYQTSQQTNNEITPGLRPLKLTPPHNLSLLPRLAFVEVKTRSRGNWDADGLLAITPPKQAKLRRTAELFLAERPDLASLPCRFDVALVRCDRLSQHSGHNETNLSPSAAAIDKTIQVPSVQVGQPIVVAGYRFILQDYIESAFD